MVISVIARMHATGFFCGNFIGASMGTFVETTVHSQVEMSQNSLYYFYAAQRDQMKKND